MYLKYLKYIFINKTHCYVVVYTVKLSKISSVIIGLVFHT